jgi:hypothetical protein
MHTARTLALQGREHVRKLRASTAIRFCDCSRRGCGLRAPRLCAQAEAYGRSGLWDGASHFGAIVVPTARPEFIGIPAAFAARRASVLPPQRQPDHDFLVSEGSLTPP